MQTKAGHKIKQFIEKRDKEFYENLTEEENKFYNQQKQTRNDILQKHQQELEKLKIIQTEEEKEFNDYKEK